MFYLNDVCEKFIRMAHMVFQGKCVYYDYKMIVFRMEFGESDRGMFCANLQ